MSKSFRLKWHDGDHFRTKVHITRAKGEQMVEEGKAFYREDSLGVYFELPRPETSNVRTALLESSLRIKAREIPGVTGVNGTSAVLTKAEVEAAIGLRGPSRTAGMSEEERAEQIRKGWRAEDLVERSREKLKAFRPGKLQVA